MDVREQVRLYTAICFACKERRASSAHAKVCGECGSRDMAVVYHGSGPRERLACPSCNTHWPGSGACPGCGRRDVRSSQPVPKPIGRRG